LAASERIASAIRARGIAPGERVVITGPQRFASIAALLGVFRARAVAVPIDRGLPPARRRLMAEESRARLVLVVEDRDDAAPFAGLPLDVLALPAAIDEDLPPGDPGELPRADDPAYVFFTSGTSGTPKGVLGWHKGISHFVSWQRGTFGLGPGDRFAQLTG